jgi:hypothetical protein
MAAAAFAAVASSEMISFCKDQQAIFYIIVRLGLLLLTGQLFLSAILLQICHYSLTISFENTWSLSMTLIA